MNKVPSLRILKLQKFPTHLKEILMDSKQLKSVIESLLFVSGEPIRLAKLVKICSVPKDDIISEINSLNDDYQKEQRGFNIIQKEDLFQLATNSENSEFVSQLVSGELGTELSRAALEVLSIVAYRGPVTRMQIETIRGVNCSYVLRSLLIRGLVERKDTVDIRGYLYEISFDFLKSLGHEALDCGAYDERSVDYPDVAQEVGQNVAGGWFERGILICGTGIGVSIAANKVDGVRAALCCDTFMAERARKHNDANVLCLGAERTQDPLEIVRVFITTDFEKGHHQSRLDKITRMEQC